MNENSEALRWFALGYYCLSVIGKFFKHYYKDMIIIMLITIIAWLLIDDNAVNTQAEINSMIKDVNSVINTLE